MKTQGFTPCRLQARHYCLWSTALALTCLVLCQTVAVASGVSSISSNFNGTAISSGRTLWFNSIISPSNLGTGTATVWLSDATVTFTANSTNYVLPVPDAVVTFAPSGTIATSFSGGTWQTTTHKSGLAGNTWLSGFGYASPGLPGGINPVTWQGHFWTDVPGLTLNWQWSAAVYTSFNTDYSTLNVKPIDDNASVGPWFNADKAGVPEAYKSFVTGGARGGGGSNWTGSMSATGSVVPDLIPEPASMLVLLVGCASLFGVAVRRRR